ncbi:10944_t:CDS:2 [Gigaspora margarita]|uniref:10944_t:CDS:1 n=1 Tax=Gigaspora margarita TaxID=4874 RepID=A0ABM8VW09_GIGMA|nr:10944_t:CDS:2 [Gigaspora margarita]
MKSHGFDIKDWVPYSPNLNPIENLWERLDSMLCNRRPAPKTHEELVMFIKEEWYKISLEYIRLLIYMPFYVKLQTMRNLTYSLSELLKAYFRSNSMRKNDYAVFERSAYILVIDIN